MADLDKGGRFLRADSALKLGIHCGFAVPCPVPGPDSCVMAFLSAGATPIVRHFESGLPEADGSHLRRSEGSCEIAGALDLGGAQDGEDRGQGAPGQAFACCVPTVSLQAAMEPGGVGSAARAVGLNTVVALPVLQAGHVPAGW